MFQRPAFIVSRLRGFIELAGTNVISEKRRKVVSLS